MSNTEDTGDPNSIKENVSCPRESLILTAINFLQNPNVRRRPLSQKQKFLRSKGLTEDEIQIACERAGAFSIDPNNSTVISMDISTSSPQHSSSSLSKNFHHRNHHQLIEKPSVLSRIRDVLNSVALFGGLAYACYIFYKRFIEPFLFGKKRKKTVEETLEEMNENVEKRIQEINQELTRVREEITHNNQNETITREFNNFKSDLETIKGLLLNRKQFANPIPIVPPSIPAWQLTSQSHHHHHPETENEQDKNDDAGSGSGSSETEVVTKNSDSSLEIM